LVTSDKILTKVLKEVPDIVIENLNLTDSDSKKSALLNLGRQATRPNGTQNIFDLERPQAKSPCRKVPGWLPNPFTAAMTRIKTCCGWGDVQIFHDKGFQFTTDELQADMNDHTAWGEKPVLIQGGFGEIRGKGFRLLDGGKVIVVNGPGTALLNLHAAKPLINQRLVIRRTGSRRHAPSTPFAIIACLVGNELRCVRRPALPFVEGRKRPNPKAGSGHRRTKP